MKTIKKTTRQKTKIPPVQEGDMITITPTTQGTKHGDVIAILDGFVIVIKGAGEESIGKELDIKVTALKNSYCFAIPMR